MQQLPAHGQKGGTHHSLPAVVQPTVLALSSDAGGQLSRFVPLT